MSTRYNGANAAKGAGVAGATRVALYVRVSTDEQKRHGFSLADQRRTLRQHAEREGFVVAEEVADEGLSGANLYRPGLGRVLELAGEGAIDLVLAAKRDRFFRDLYLRRGFERDLARHRVRLVALDDLNNRVADGVMDLLAEEQRREIAKETRRGRLQRARSGRVVAGVPPYGFRFNADNTNFVVAEAEMAVVRRIFSMVAGGVSLNGIKNALQEDGTATPRGGTLWSRAVLRQMVLDDAYLARTHEEMRGLAEEGMLAGDVLASLDPSRAHAVWWFNRESVESYYDDDRKRRRFRQNPREEWIAVPIPDPGVPREHVEGARRRIADNRAPSGANRRFWELSGGLLFCPCGRRMTTFTARRKAGPQYYYVCGLRRSNSGTCGHGAKYHPAPAVEGRVRGFVLGLLRDPEVLRGRVEAQVEEERRALRAPEAQVKGWKERLAALGRKRSGHLDQQAEGIISMAELRQKLDALESERRAAERELSALEDREKRAGELDALPALVDSYLADLPYLLDRVPAVHGYETVPEPRTEDNPLGVFTLTPERIRRLPEEEVRRRERAAEDERAARYRRMYEDLGLRAVAHPDGTLEITWRFGEATLRTGSDTSKNKHATKHFRSTEHPLVQSFEPGEDWVFCYVDNVVMEPR